MEKDQSPVTGRLVDLTLEIIYLLTGEYYKVVKETSGEPLTPSRVSAVTWPPPQVNSGKKILEVMQKMTRLLAEEVGVKYLDITREEYIEGRKDLYKDVVMEDEPDGSRKRNPPQRCPRPRDSTQEDETIPQLSQDKEFKVIKIKEEEHELAVNEARQFIEMGDPENSCDSMTDNSSSGNNEDEKLRDIIEEDEEKERSVLAEEQKDIGVKNEEEGTSARRAQKSTKAGQAKKQKDIGVKNEEEGTLVSRAQQSTEEEHVTIVKIEEEESPLHVETHGRHVWNVPEEHHLVSPANDLMQYSPGAIVITLNHQTSMDPSNFQGPFITQAGTVVLNHEDSHTGKSLFACLECKKTFTKKRNLRRHEKIHAAGRPSCLECGKFFICEEQLLTHQTTIHNGEQPYTCLVCRKGFTAKKSLLRHLKIHTGERPFSCPVCGRCFVNKGNLASHQKIHVMEHTFPCSECGKSFICETDLNEHEKIHMGDRPYSCSDCDKSFPVKSSLLRHQKVHTGNRPEGGNSSSQKEDHVSHQEDHVSHQEDHVSHQEDHVSHQEDHVSHQEDHVSHQEDLVSHQTIHTGELPYFCAVCGECFTEEKELRIHQRIHTQVLPYKCSNCGESFMHIEELHTHRNSCLESGKSSVEEKELQSHLITDHTEERPYSCLKCEESFSQIDDLITHQKCHPETDPETFNPEAKRKRRSYEAAFKLLVVARAEESNNRIASKQFCVHEKQVRDWRNMKDDLIRIPKDKKAKRGLTTRYEALEAELHKWVMECRQMGHAVTRREIRLRALQMAKDEQLQIPGIERFVASGGWCTRFMNRFSLCTRQTTKKLPEDLDEKLMSFHSFIVNQRMIHNYDLGDIGNMDEIPMTFDLPSNRTVPSLGDEAMLLGTTGNEKNHFTVVLSCLANGTKLRPVVIFKRNTLPEEVEFPPRVTVHTHGKGWIDEERTKEWMEDIWNTRPGAASNKPSLLVWDRFRVHTSNDIKALAKASQVTLAFIPGGLTSVLQPLHVCLKQPFKDRVKKMWREWMSSDQVQLSLAGDVMKPDIEMIATWVRDAWEEIPEDLVQRAFKKCGISNAMDGSEEGALHENDSGDDCEFSDDDNVYADTLTPANAEALFGHTDNEDNEEESGFEGL